MSRLQVFCGLLNLLGEIAMPATLFCLWEIETETRDSDSPTSQVNLPRARTAPLTIFRDGSKLDRMFHLPRLAMGRGRRQHPNSPRTNQRARAGRSLDWADG